MARVKGLPLGKIDKLGERYSNKVNAAIRRTLKQLANNLDPNNPSVDNVTDLWRAEVDNGLGVDLGEAYLNSAQYVYDQLVKKRDALTAAVSLEPVTNQAAQIYLSSRMNFIRNIGFDVWTVVRAQLLEGLRGGESIPQISARIISSSAIAEPRADVIARTEIVGAANAGSYQQMLAAGVPATKTWLATSDGRTRHSHDAADGQEVQLSEKFDVGGSFMDRPHDPTAPASEVVNCRCTLTFEIGDEEFEEAEDLVAAAEVHTGAMIALVPSDEDLDRLAIEGGEPKEELHLTLWFLGEASDYSEDERTDMESKLRSTVGDLGLDPVIGHAFGINFWNPESADPAWVLAVGNATSFGLEDMRALAVEAFDKKYNEVYEQNHRPWASHVTLAYGTENPGIDSSHLGKITFDKLRLAFGNEVKDISLTGDKENALE